MSRRTLALKAMKAGAAAAKTSAGEVKEHRQLEDFAAAVEACPYDKFVRAVRVFHQISDHVSRAGDTASSGFSASYRGRHVNYARLCRCRRGNALLSRIETIPILLGSGRWTATTPGCWTAKRWS